MHLPPCLAYPKNEKKKKKTVYGIRLTTENVKNEEHLKSQQTNPILPQ